MRENRNMSHGGRPLRGVLGLPENERDPTLCGEPLGQAGSTRPTLESEMRCRHEPGDVESSSADPRPNLQSQKQNKRVKISRQ